MIDQLPGWLDREAFPFTPHEIDGLAVTDVGRGPTVLFAHGTPTWSFEWRHLLADLSRDHRCIAPDHLGFGLSRRPRDADYSPEAHARRFGELADRLELDGVTLVVHDYGGPIALPWAIAHPERIRRLVVLNSWMWAFDDPAMQRRARLAGSRLGRWLYRWANFSLRVLAPSVYGDRRKLTPAIHAQYLAPFGERWARGEVLWSLARGLLGSAAHFDALWHRRAALAAIPTCIVWGMRDGAFGPPTLARWRTALPHAEVVELAGAGHWPHEEEPAAVIAALRSFVTRPQADTGTARAASPAP